MPTSPTTRSAGNGWPAPARIAAPYFRIFNPMLQAKRFDPRGDYIRRWVPELGTDAYPAPIVDLARAREAALQAYRNR
jgi:deoxyribodipyrimidine photo-lyase